MNIYRVTYKTATGTIATFDFATSATKTGTVTSKAYDLLLAMGTPRPVIISIVSA